MIHPDIPIKALSIMQPWAWLIVNGHKNIENREWSTKFRGLVAIHAGKKEDEDCVLELTRPDGPFHPVTGNPIDIDTGSKLISSDGEWDTYSNPAWNDQRGGIVGVAEIVNCIRRPHLLTDDPWFVGQYGFVIANARPVPFIPVKGALSFFDWRKNL